MTDVSGPAGAEGAAFAACVLCGLQDAGVDAANYFRGDAGAFGLFDESGAPAKPFHAFRAFRSLLETPRRVGTEGPEPGRAAAYAGLDAAGSAATVLLANYRSAGTRFDLSLSGLPWRGPTEWEVSVLDASRDLERVASGRGGSPPDALAVELPAPAVAVVRLRRPAEGR